MSVTMWGLSALSLLTVLAWPQDGAATEDTIRVLFIGNSYTRFNNLPSVVRRIAESAPESSQIRTRRETHGGFDLRQHWRRSRARSRIAHGHFDAVVLQDHSEAALRQPDEARQYAERFSAEVRESGAALVLFETWARHESSPFYRHHRLENPQQMQAEVGEFYERLGADLQAAVSPVGQAWQRAGEALPRTRLHRPDGTHPAIAGTYLSACVLYGTLTHQDPRETSYRPWQLSRGRAERIRALAAETIAD